MVRGLIGALATLACALVAPAAAGAIAPPANDDFANRQVVSGPLPVDLVAANDGATKEEGEYLGGIFGSGHSVWFEWQAPADDWYTIGACAATFTSAMQIFTGTELTNLVPVTHGNANDGPGCMYSSREYSFKATAGAHYVIAVDGNGFHLPEGPAPDTEGTFTLQIDETLVPGNDDFADASILGGEITQEPGGARRYFAHTLGFNWTAGSEPGEPDVAATAGTTVWYRWTPPESGTVRFNACCAALPIRIYTGNELGTLQLLGSAVAFKAEAAVTAGQTYYVAVDGGQAEPGGEPVTSSFSLMAEMELPPSPPLTVQVTRVETVVTNEDRKPPQTSIRWRQLSGSGGARFLLLSSEVGSRFRCRLDGRRVPCRARKVFKHLAPGRHLLEVAAIDAAGNADPTPAVKSFRVPPERRKPPR
jgi:hypothetical protein